MTSPGGIFAPEKSANGSLKSFSSGKRSATRADGDPPLFVRGGENGYPASNAENGELVRLASCSDGNRSATMPRESFDPMHPTGIHIQKTDLGRRNEN